MSFKRTEFHKQSRGSTLENEDSWTLVTDNDTGQQFIEHRWSHKPQVEGKVNEGAMTVPLSDFLEGDTDPELLAKLMGVAGS
jgi:hypothetical protein